MAIFNINTSNFNSNLLRHMLLVITSSYYVFNAKARLLSSLTFDENELNLD